MKSIIRIMLFAIVSLMASCADKDEPITQPEEPQPPEAKPNYLWKISIENEPAQIIWSGSKNQFAEYHFKIQAPDDLAEEKTCIVSAIDNDNLYLAMSNTGIFNAITLTPLTPYFGLTSCYYTDLDKIIVTHEGKRVDATKPMEFTIGGEKGLSTTFTVTVPVFAVYYKLTSYRFLDGRRDNALQITEIVGELNREMIDLTPCAFTTYYCRSEILINDQNGLHRKIIQDYDGREEYTVDVPLVVVGDNPNPSGIKLSVLAAATSGKARVSVAKEHIIPAGELEYKIPVTFSFKKTSVKGEFNAAASLRITAEGEPLENGEASEIAKCTESGYVELCIPSEYKLNIDPLKVSSDDEAISKEDLAKLFDEHPATFCGFHWKSNRAESFGSYVEVELPKAVSHIAVEMVGTSTSGINSIGPKTYSIYYSTSGDEGSWKTLCEKTTISNPIYKDGKRIWIGGTDDDQWLVAPENYKYLRFCVFENSSGEPTVTEVKHSGYWNLGELHFFGK